MYLTIDLNIIGLYLVYNGLYHCRSCILSNFITITASVEIEMNSEKTLVPAQALRFLGLDRNYQVKNRNI